MAIDATGLMQPIRYEIDINNGLVQTPMRTQLMRGDAKANRVVVALKNGSENVDLSGVTVTGSFVRPPDEAVIPLNGSASGNEAAVELIDACYAEDGYCEIDVMLTVSQTRRTILSLTGYVLKKGSGAVVDVGDVIPSIDDIIAQYAEMQRVTTATQAAGTAATTAASNANEKAQAAQTAATAANTAATEAGAAAGKIDNMTVAATALDTGQPPTAALSEEDGHYLLSLGLPRGATGATPQISVQVTTGAPGSQASVSVTGTAENPVIHLTIPRGNAGSVTAVNGKAPDASGEVTLEMSDIYGLTDAIDGAGKVKSVAGKSPDSAGNITLTASDVGALASGGTAVNSSKLGGKTLAQIMLTIYPVGAVYISANSTSPASLFGGTWEQLKDRFLLAAGSTYSAGSTGGLVAHSITNDNLPLNMGSFTFYGYDGEEHRGIVNVVHKNNFKYSVSGDGNVRFKTVTLSGSGTALDTMPPYLAVYMWKRVS